MGSDYSSLKNSFSSKSIPKHLKPSKPKRKKEKSFNEKEQEVSENKNNNVMKKPDIHMFDEYEDQFTEQDILKGSGPRSAFKWFKGRRYLNHAKQGGLLGNGVLPNDQLELDRLRVLSFIIRWAFEGDIVAPVEDQLKNGIEVLNVGYGPGMWAGHYIIDLAMDYKNSNFTIVETSDLLPKDFEETAEDNNVVNDPTIDYNNRSFTPIHPNLSVKLQSSTTPAITTTTTTTTDSSTLGSDSSFSNVLLSHIEEESTQCTIDSSTTTTTKEEEQTADHLFTGTPKPDLLNFRKLLPNLNFYRMNAIDAKLPFEDNTFDFVKQRLVTSSFTVADWKRVIEELVRVTKVGGYIELVEIDYNTFNLGPEGRKWETELLEAVRTKGNMEPRMARSLPDLLKTAGLIDVSTKLVSVPLGSWGLDLGSLWKHNLEMFADSSCPLLSKLTGLSDSEYRARWRTLLSEVKDDKAFSNLHAAWGRKPFKHSTHAIDWSSFSPLT